MHRRVLLATLGIFMGVALAAPVPKPKGDDFGPVTKEQKERSRNNLKEIALAMMNYESAYGFLPSEIRDRNDNPMLSWRVCILPYIEEGDLYKSFKFDEPWDSKNNIKLVEKMPKVFRPIRVKTKEAGYTYYRGFTGKGTIFERNVKQFITGITDGTSNTACIIEAGEPVIWTKPESDLPFDLEKDLPKLGGLFEGEFQLAMCDGRVMKGSVKQMDTIEFKKLLTKNDGEVVKFDKALGEKNQE